MKKIILTTLVVVISGFVMFFVGGSLYYMDAIAEMAAAFPDAVKNPSDADITMGVANIIVLSLFTTISFDRMGISTVASGAKAGAWFMGLLFLVFNTQMLAQYNTMDVNFAVLDTAISAVMGAVLGAACGFGLGRFSK
tara:strand:- start:7263 stop:7676 length:414 start_codon:yes stop_codon:yes gene_type:complete